MADGRLGQAEAIACCSEAPKVPNCEKDTQQIKVEMAISWGHTKDYYYEFDLVQAGRHRGAMATNFNAGCELRKKISAGKPSSVEVPSDGYEEMSDE